MTRFLPIPIALLLLAGCESTSTAPGSANLRSNQTAEANPGGSLPADAPAWVTDASKHPSYPLARFMTAIGTSDARDPAEENGRKNLSEQLNSEIKAETEVYLREVSVDGEYASTLDHTEKVRNRSEALLRGSRTVDEYRHAGTVYVLVVLDREKHAQAALQEIDSELGKLHGAASPVAGSGRLRTLIEEHAILERVTGDLINVGVVLPKGHSMRSGFDPRMASTTARTRAVLSEYLAQEVTVRPVAGMGQHGYPGETLAERIIFEVQAAGRPVVGFPVTFALEHPERAELLEADPQTGPDGRVSCAITGIQLTGEEENDVRVALDYASLGEEGLEPPRAVVSFLLPTMKSAAFAIAIEETNITTVNPESVVRAAIEVGLGERDAKMVKLGAFLSAAEISEAATASSSWLKGKLEGHVDYLVRGTARSVVSSTRGPIVYTYAGGSFELIDVRNGQLIASLTLAPASGSGSKGTGNHEFGSGAAALRKLGGKVQAEFMARIDGVFLVQ